MKTHLILIVLSFILSCNGQKKIAQMNNAKAEINDSTFIIIRNDIQEISFDFLVNSPEFGSNFVFSPAATYYNLLPIFFGAKTNSEKELMQIFSFSNSQKGFYNIETRLFPAFTSENYSMNTFNGILFDTRYTFLDSYKKFISSEIQYELLSKDFSDRELLAGNVNQLISDNTNNKIQQIISADELVNARMIIMNAIYFKSDWYDKFDQNLTNEDFFHLSDNERISVLYMHKTADYKYFENEFYQVIELKYANEEASFVAALPKEGINLQKAVNVFNEDFENTMSELSAKKIRLSIPKIALTYKSDLKTILEQMNVKEIFSDKADLSGITGNKELFVDKVVQAVTFVLDEEGSEAAAANVTVVKEKGASMVIEMNINRPFFFFVRNNKNNIILFSGLVSDPTQN